MNSSKKYVVVVNILVSFTSKKYNFTINIGHRFLIQELPLLNFHHEKFSATLRMKKQHYEDLKQIIW